MAFHDRVEVAYRVRRVGVAYYRDRVGVAFRHREEGAFHRRRRSLDNCSWFTFVFKWLNYYV